jgi:hypothetical protein
MVAAVLVAAVLVVIPILDGIVNDTAFFKMGEDKEDAIALGDLLLLLLFGN